MYIIINDLCPLHTGGVAICATQHATRPVCIEHYISTSSKPARRVS